MKVWVKEMAQNKSIWYGKDVVKHKDIPIKEAVFQAHNNNIKRDYRKRSLFQTNKKKRRRY